MRTGVSHLPHSSDTLAAGRTFTSKPLSSIRHQRQQQDRDLQIALRDEQRHMPRRIRAGVRNQVQVRWPPTEPSDGSALAATVTALAAARCVLTVATQRGNDGGQGNFFQREVRDGQRSCTARGEPDRRAAPPMLTVIIRHASAGRVFEQPDAFVDPLAHSIRLADLSVARPATKPPCTFRTGEPSYFVTRHIGKRAFPMVSKVIGTWRVYCRPWLFTSPPFSEPSSPLSSCRRSAGHVALPRPAPARSR